MMKKRITLPDGIYGITAEKFSRDRSNIDIVRSMIKSGVKIIQYREKHACKSFKQMHEECSIIRKMTKDENVIFIVNDYIDIALMVEADGVHIGQDDFPIESVRQLKKDLIIGVSTHSPDQASEAIRKGADYIGVGPIFQTQTKEDVCSPVGLSYLEYAAKHVSIPFVAIGGIKLHNIKEVIQKGARTVSLVTEIVAAENIETRIEEIQRNIQIAKQTDAVNG